MKKILILANNSVGLYAFRLELIQKLLNEGYAVYFSVPESTENEKVKAIVKTGAKHVQTYINRRGMNPFEDLKLIKRYKKIMLELNPDLILTYTIKPNIYGTYVANKLKKPVIMNITGGSNLSLYEVNEAAEIVTSASDPDVNMIFGAIIEESMKDEIKVTVIATGFDHKPSPSAAAQVRRPANAPNEPAAADKNANLRPFGNQTSSDQLDIPTFLRNRTRGNND